MPTALQVIGLLYYIACGVGLATALLVYENARAARDQDTMHPGAVPAACIVGLLWPVTLPVFGVIASVIILHVERKFRRGESP